MKWKMTTMFFVADGTTIHGCGCLVLFLAQAYHRGMQFLFYTVWCERSEKNTEKYQEETTGCSKEQIRGISGTIS
jgi:hypothetical protein